jgi:AbrB family looped-hinge helix DNA binding protein
MTTTVRLNRKYQIVIPQAAREALSLSAGDELLVLCKSDRVVIIPKPVKFSRRTKGTQGLVMVRFPGVQTPMADERLGSRVPK